MPAKKNNQSLKEEIKDIINYFNKLNTKFKYQSKNNKKFNFKINIYDTYNKPINFMSHTEKTIKQNINYSRLYNDLYKARKLLEEIPISNRYKAKAKAKKEEELKKEVKKLDDYKDKIDNIYDHYNRDLTEDSIKQNIKDYGYNNKKLYPLFNNRIFRETRYNKNFNNIKNYKLIGITPEEAITGNIKKYNVAPLLLQLKELYGSYKYNISIGYTTYDRRTNRRSHHIYQTGDDKTCKVKPVIVREKDNSDELFEKFNEAREEIEQQLATNELGSDFTVENVDEFYINVVNIDNMTGSSYIKYEGKYNRCIINPQNFDNNHCFYYAVAIGLIKNKTNEKIEHLERITVIDNYLKKLNIKIDDSMLNYPVSIDDKKQLKAFEEANNITLLIHLESKSLIYPNDITEINKDRIQLHLMLLEDKNSNNYHYVFINCYSSFVKKDKNIYYFCKECDKKISYNSIETHYKTHHKTYIELEKRRPDLIELIKKANKKLPLKKTDKEFKKMFDNYDKKPKETPKELICDFCMNKFKTMKEIEHHKQVGCPCLKDPREVVYCKEKNLVFDKYEALGMLNTYIVADFESVLKKYNKHKTDTLILKNAQVPFMYCLKIVSKYIPEKLFIYKGKSSHDTMRHFYKDIYGISYYYNKFIKENQKEMINTPEWDEKFINEKNCYLCGCELSEDFTAENGKCKDHDHITGEILGIACKRCNLKRTEKQRYIPLIFHNAKNYDNHHILKYFDLVDNNLINKVNNIENLDDLDNIDVNEKIETNNTLKGYIKNTININTEKSLSLTLGVQHKVNKNEQDYYIDDKNFTDIRIIDSCQFFLKSLEELVEILKKDGIDNFKYMKEYFKDKTEDILRKNLMSYRYFDNYNKYDNPVEELYDKKLYDEFNKEKYNIMLDTIKKFNIKTAGEYYYIYLICDVLELADFIVSAREKLKETHKLDILQFYGAPSYTWNCFLYESRIELEHIKDINKLSFFKKMIRGGPSFISKRYAKANNIYCKDYNKLKRYTYLEYLDMNNLYGAAMKQPLPYGEIEKIDDKTIEKYNKNIEELWKDYPNYTIDPTAKNINKDDIFDGCCLDVDLEIPKKYHKLYDMYPLLPEQLEITEEMTSNYTKDLVKRMNKKHTKQTLLTQTLYDKKNYKIYYKMLKLSVDLGVKIKKINYGYKFKEKAYMKEYIEKNTDLRTKAKENKDSMGIELYKLLNNAVYGKTLENVFNYKDFKYVDDNNLINYTSKPSYRSATIINKKNILLEKKGEKVKINKPIYVGAVITDIAKYLMFNFHYNYLIPEFGLENVHLLFTDTDSLCYELETKDEEERIKHYKNLINKGVLDTSTYSEENPLYSKENNIIGIMKCEEGDNALTEFAGLRAKMYAIKMIKNGLLEEERKCKGVKKSVVKKDLNFDKYKNLIFNEQSKVLSYNCKITNIRSYNQQIYDQELEKCALSCDDTKRYIIDNINTHAYGFEE